MVMQPAFKEGNASNRMGEWDAVCIGVEEGINASQTA